MGWWKAFGMFCREHGLNPDKESSVRYFEAGRVREVPKISAERGLTWHEVDELTLGRVGTHAMPCPYCGAEKTYSSRFQIKRTLTHAQRHCFYCGMSGEAESGEVPTPEQEQAAREQYREEKQRTIARALKLWQEAEPINNTLALTYLRARGLEPPPNPDSVLRWHRACKFGVHGRVGCMLALFRDALTDRPTGIHRTYITSATGGEAERMALGRIAGAMIKLWPLTNNNNHLAVGEGIETVLAAVKLGAAEPPAWAATVANNLGRLPVIPGVARLTILADNDESGTGERDARALRRVWMARGRQVAIRMPTDGSTDFNDLVGRRP
jgi:hypothetical protein